MIAVTGNCNKPITIFTSSAIDGLAYLTAKYSTSETVVPRINNYDARDAVELGGMYRVFRGEKAKKGMKLRNPGHADH